MSVHTRDRHMEHWWAGTGHVPGHTGHTDQMLRCEPEFGYNIHRSQRQRDTVYADID